MKNLDELVNCGYDESEIEELKTEIDTKAIVAVYTIEKMWELLKDSNLPESAKIALLTDIKEGE